MADSKFITPVLERTGGDPVFITGNCSIGRAVGNDVVLVDDRVSRRHATIHAQDAKEFLLVDLGSRNGTYLNGRRVNQPTVLRNGDQLQVGPFTLTFRQSADSPIDSPAPKQEAQTMVDLKMVPCWLLLCDITGSSILAREKSSGELAVLIGSWFRRSKEVIEDNGGVINKYLGDGFLAYWRGNKEVLAHVSQSLRDLAQLQDLQQPPFRVVLHFGQVMIGGIPSSGEDSLAGPEVNFVFRLERLASELRLHRLASETAIQTLGSLVTSNQAGRHPLQGFQGEFPVFAF